MSKTTVSYNRLLRNASWASILVAVTLIGLKLFTFFLTASAAILATLIDSSLDFLASLVNFLAIKSALVPADKDHRFGHEKAESLGGLMQGLFILGTSAFLFNESVERFLHPKGLAHLDTGLFIMSLSIVLTFFLLFFQSYVIKRTGSIAIKADKAHYQGDILMNIGVMVSMTATYFFNLSFIDALFALGVAVYLLITAVGIIREALGILMDKELCTNDRQEIKKIVLSFEEVLDIKELKTRSAGKKMFIQFNALFSPDLPLQTVHKVSDKIEKELRKKFDDCDIIIHQEPSANPKRFF